jgi:hypothetical protein
MRCAQGFPLGLSTVPGAVAVLLVACGGPKGVVADATGGGALPDGGNASEVADATSLADARSVADAPLSVPDAGADASGSVDVVAPRSGELTALTYNVAGLPEGLSGSQPAMNTPYISPLLNDYDVVLVQEDWLTASGNILGLTTFHSVLAAQATHPYQSMPAPWPLGLPLLPAPGGARPKGYLSDGLNEFSRFELRDVTRVAWTGCFGGINTSDNGAADCLATKGFTVATHVFASGAEADVYTLHAEAGSTAQDQMLSEADYKQLGAYIVMHSASRAVILGGDTNLHVDTEPADAIAWRDLLTTTGLADVCDVLACGADATLIDKFAFRNGGGIRIDALTHHFEREKFVRPDGAPLSDHLALAVRFRWTRQ